MAAPEPVYVGFFGAGARAMAASPPVERALHERLCDDPVAGSAHEQTVLNYDFACDMRFAARALAAPRSGRAALWAAPRSDRAALYDRATLGLRRALVTPRSGRQGKQIRLGSPNLALNPAGLTAV